MKQSSAFKPVATNTINRLLNSLSIFVALRVTQGYGPRSNWYWRAQICRKQFPALNMTNSLFTHFSMVALKSFESHCVQAGTSCTNRNQCMHAPLMAVFSFFLGGGGGGNSLSANLNLINAHRRPRPDSNEQQKPSLEAEMKVFSDSTNSGVSS